MLKLLGMFDLFVSFGVASVVFPEGDAMLDVLSQP